MGGPKVSIIMNCLNGERYLRQAIDSAFNQTYKEWEIIFWDNGSTDASAEIAKSYGDRVHYFNSEKTLALGKARNLCMAQAKGNYIAFLDCDDIWLPQKLEKQVPLFERDNEVGLVFSDAIYFNENGIICQLYKKAKPSRGRMLGELLRKYHLCITSVMIRKSAVQNIEWFNNTLSLCEDACFFLRLAYRFKLDYCDEPLVKYRVRPDSSTIKNFGGFAQERDLILEVMKNEFPNFEKEYEEDLKFWQAKTTTQKAINEWINKNPENARRILKNISIKNPLIYALFLITFLPISTFKTLFILNYKIKSWFNWYKFG
jgi:glycosyltransferase involved in cell wall biosynthesis